MRYSDLFSQSLEQPGSDSPGSPLPPGAMDVQLLMEDVFHLSRTEFWIKKNEPITNPGAVRKFLRLLARLKKNEPTAYILNKKEFYGEPFFINKHVLIPRPETELLVEAAIPLSQTASSILDIGTGSGIISIMLAKHSNAHITALDKSRKALDVLKKNMHLHGIKDQITAECGDLFPKVKKTFDLIVSNPPYIPVNEWEELAPGVKDYEPSLALVGGEDGLDIIRRIVKNAHTYLSPGGHLLLEFGFGQKEKLRTILESYSFSIIRWIDDYSGIPRVVVSRG